LQQERIQPAGGRLDLLFQDAEKRRYEVELQLGAVDESHIIRTIHTSSALSRHRIDADGV
jgi:hypothetical protein